MTSRFALRARSLLMVALFLSLAAGARAQAPAGVLHGMVADTAGKPVADQALTLHRVNAAGGAMVDTSRTDARGRFTLKLPAESDTSALYFVATRWQGQLYIGAPFKPPAPVGTTYTVTVGVNPVQMGPATGAGAQPAGPMGGAAPAEPTAQPGSSGAGRWFLAVILGLVALGAIAYALMSAGRDRSRQRRRELLVRIAELDERAETARPDEAAAIERERADLVAQLTGD